MTEPALIREFTEGVAIWRLNRPELRNPISAEVKVALAEAAEAFRDDPEQRALIIIGTEEVFCAGGDLRAMDNSPGTVATRQRLAATHAFMQVLEEVEKPVITAVNGAAVGAGTSLAMLGDIIVASDRAYFASGFPKVGVLPDMGLLYTLPRAIGMPRAKDFVMTSRRYDAAQALEIGMVSRVVPHDMLMEEALKIGREIARGPGVSIGLSKRLMNAALNDTLPTYLLRESMGQAVVFGTEDFAEGVCAFREKRRPEFRGQ